MSERSFPLEGTVYTAEEASLWFGARTSGVLSGGDLAVSAPGGLRVSVAPGMAWLKYARFAGVAYANTDPLSLPIAPADADNPRIDRVVLRYSAAENRVFLTVKAGTPAIEPQPPGVLFTPLFAAGQDRAGTVEISLAQVRVPAAAAEITPACLRDERMDGAVCGLMADGLTTVSDAAVGLNLWTSRHTVDMLAESFTASGEWVECHPVPLEPLAVSVAIAPRQSGEGDPTPQNIRPFVFPESITLRVSNYGGLNAETYTVPLGQPLPGGTVDVTGGAVWREAIALSLTGEEDWQWYPAAAAPYAFLRLGDLNTVHADRAYCSHYVQTDITSSNTNQGFSVVNSSQNADRLLFRADETPTLAQWKAFLKAQSDAGTPVTVVYRPKASSLWTISPQTVLAKGGSATIVLPSAGTVTVQGHENPRHTLSALRKRIEALEAV